MKTPRLAVLVLVLAGAASANANAQDGVATPAAAFAQGRALLELRPRLNRIEESDKPELAEGGTVRATVGWQTAPWHGLRLTMELLHTDHFGRKRFNDQVSQIPTSPYPLLPDPTYTGANRLHADYAGIEGLRLRLGRQLVRLDNQRFVSDNDFRQIPTLFDGVAARYDGFENVSLFAARFGRVRNSRGETNALKLTLFNAAWNPAPGHGVAAYAYFHDQPRTANSTGYADNSHRVAGVRAEGGVRAFAGFDAQYLAEFAQQKPHAGGAAAIDARYWRLGGGLASDALSVRYDHEVRGSNAGRYGLQTPLTDLYAFNGWALRFTTTPREGLRDRWVTLRWALPRATLFAEHHRFDSDFGNLDFGRETDAGITVPVFDGAVLRLQHARYRSTQVRVDKTWLTLTYTY